MKVLLWAFIVSLALGLSGVDRTNGIPLALPDGVEVEVGEPELFPAFLTERRDYPRSYFRSPLGIPLLLSGSFAEMRSNHFHSGLDIKTNGKPGYRVYAAADGYVARIKVSPYGFGKAIYVKHPNGFTTVYAHLSGFNDKIERHIKKLQYTKKRFAVETFPGPGDFPVNKGEVIALSGNSGGSGGPHLHFEIRDSGSEWPINPMLFGIPVKDEVAPTLYRLKLYAADAGSQAVIHYTNGKKTTVRTDRPAVLDVARSKGRHTLSGIRRIEAQGQIGFGLELRDHHNGSRSRLGAYQVQLRADEQPLYTFTAETFGFPQTRYLNAHVDYEERRRNRRWIQRSFLLPGNRLPMYQDVTNQGYLNVIPGATHKLSYTVEDAKGNKAFMRFNIVGKTLTPVQKIIAGDYETLVPYNKAHTFTRDGLRVSFPARTFYEDVPLNYAVRTRTAKTYSRRHTVHDVYTPAHKSYTLSIQADRLPTRLQSKALIMYEDEDGDTSSIGGEYENGYVTTKTRSFGMFYVSVDTTKPTIRPLNLSTKKERKAPSTLRIKIKDDLSGIGRYNVYVDGKWMLFEYDAKKDLLVHHYDGRIKPGSHKLKAVVTDNVGNKTVYEANFVR